MKKSNPLLPNTDKKEKNIEEKDGKFVGPKNAEEEKLIE